MRKFVEYLRALSPDLIRTHEKKQFGGYGDWLNINAETPKDLIGTAFFAHVSRLLSTIAGVLGKAKEQAEYAKLFEDVRRAWQKRFVTPDGLIVAQTQTAYVLALHFDLLDEAMRPRVFQALVENIESRGRHLSTGFVGTPYLNHVLTRFGRADLAFALLEQTTYPSWLYPITQGATTMWERWNAYTHDGGFGDASMNSYNHYAYGAVGDWMYGTVAGIEISPAAPGYREIVIHPHVGGTLKHAKASLETLHGRLESAWTLDGTQLTLTVTIPPNTTATVRVPITDPSTAKPTASAVGHRPDATFPVGSGTHTFTGTYKR
jgi:alpha-L-rhamnosidase